MENNQYQFIPKLVVDANFFINKNIDYNKYQQEQQIEFYTTQQIINELVDFDTKQRLQMFQEQFKLNIIDPDKSYISKIKLNAINCGEIISIGQNDIEILALTLQLTEQYDKDYKYQQIERIVSDNGIMYDQYEMSKTYERRKQQQIQEQKQLDYERNKLLQSLKKNKKSNAQKAIEAALYGDDEQIEQEQQQQEEEESQQEQELNQDLQQNKNSKEDQWVTADNIDLLEDDILIQSEQEPLHKVSLFTLDNAMQNVALQLKLKLATSNNQTIKSTQQYVLKCSACRAIFTNMEYVLRYHRNKNFNTQLFNPNNLTCPECAHHCLMRISMYVNENGIKFSKGIKNFRDEGKVNYAVMANKKWSQVRNKYLLNPELYEDKMLQGYQPTKQTNINFDAYVQGTNSNLQNSTIPYWMKKRSKGAKHNSGVN